MITIYLALIIKSRFQHLFENCKKISQQESRTRMLERASELKCVRQMRAND
jgi:hypothetical protein